MTKYVLNLEDADNQIGKIRAKDAKLAISRYIYPFIYVPINYAFIYLLFMSLVTEFKLCRISQLLGVSVSCKEFRFHFHSVKYNQLSSHKIIELKKISQALS